MRLVVEVYFPILLWRADLNPRREAPAELIQSIAGTWFGARNAWISDFPASWSVTLCEPPHRVRQMLDKSRGAKWPYRQCAKFTFTSDYPGEAAAREVLSYAEDSPTTEDIWWHVFQEIIESELFAYQVAANLALPGAELIGSAVTKFGRHLKPYSGRYSHNWELYEHVEGRGDRSIEPIPFRKVWSWLASSNGFRSGVSDTPASKALAALTYLYEAEILRGRLSSLIWGCAGLEAFYGDEGGSRHSQLSTRIPAFLDGIDAAQCKKDIALIYRVRSSIIHGNRGISSAVAGSDAMPDSHFDEESSARWAANYYLSETLRRCITSGFKSAKFRVVLA